MNAIHLLRAPTTSPVPVTWPAPSVVPSTPGPPATWAPPPPAPEAPPPAAPRSRRGLILPIIAAVVLVLGLGLAVGGLAARSSAQASAHDATEQLATVTGQRDKMATSLGTATADMNTAQAMADASVLASQQALTQTPALAAAADRLAADFEAMASAEVAYEAALSANDVRAANAAVGAYNAALADTQVAWTAYEDAAIAILTGTDGSITVTMT